MESKKAIIRIRPAEARTLLSWSSYRDTINFDPAYQRRNKVWSEAEQSFLIDSVLNGFSMPQIYLHDLNAGLTIDGPTEFHYAVIDGKQRLSALFKFIDNKLKLKDNFVFLEDPSLNLKGLTLYNLQLRFPKVAHRIEQYNVPIVEVTTDSRDRVTQLFQRLNYGKSLNGAELRNSFGTSITNSIAEIANHKFWTSNASLNTNRMQAHNYAAKLLMIQCLGVRLDTTKSSLDKFSRNHYLLSENDVQEAFSVVTWTLDAFHRIFDKKDETLKKLGIITVFYIFYHSISLSSSEVVSDNAFHKFIQFFQRERRRSAGDFGEINEDSFWLFDALSKFNLLNRSIDGRISIIERVEIMESIFEKVELWA